MLIATKPN